MRLYRRAAFIALFYFIFGIAYILVSDRIVANLSPSVVFFETIGRIKGILFVTATALALFFFTSGQIKRVIGDAVNLLQNRTLLFSFERKSLAGLFSLTLAEDLKRLIATQGGSSNDEQIVARIQELAQKLESAGKLGLNDERRTVDFCSFIRSTVDIARGYSPVVRGCEINLGPCESFKVSIFAGLFHQMLVNLLLNSAEAMQGAGSIKLDLRRSSDEVAFEVHDNGPGIPADKWKTLLDPFYSAKRDKMGFGLLAVKACAAAHGGRVEISASPMGGARIDVIFPASILV